MIHTLSAIEIRDKFLKGELSAVEITEAFLKRIDQYNAQIGAFLTVLRERALEKAKSLDAKKAAGKKMGKLAGIPIAIKDNMHIKGEISTCGSKFLTNYKAPFECYCRTAFRRRRCYPHRQNQYGRICHGLLDRKFCFAKN